MVAHLCLGTASWATDQPYNGRTAPSDAEVARILDVAEAGGVRFLDTARAYGNVTARLAQAKAAERWNPRFRVISKDPIFGIPRYDDTRLRSAGADDLHPTAMLLHMKPDDEWWRYWDKRDDKERQLCGASVYTVAQATAALDAGVQVLQVPWNKGDRPAVVHRGEIADGWEMIRDRAYADGVLFFGRQPFARGADVRRKAFAWALTTNPRGWCVVGVESAAQLSELLAWRDGLA